MCSLDRHADACEDTPSSIRYHEYNPPCLPCGLVVLPAAYGPQPQTANCIPGVPQGGTPSLSLFSNPAASIMSLEAAVRHDWDTPAVPGVDSTGLKLACNIFLAVIRAVVPSPQLLPLEDRSHLLQ